MNTELSYHAICMQDHLFSKLHLWVPTFFKYKCCIIMNFCCILHMDKALNPFRFRGHIMANPELDYSNCLYVWMSVLKVLCDGLALHPGYTSFQCSWDRFQLYHNWNIKCQLAFDSIVSQRVVLVPHRSVVLDSDLSTRKKHVGFRFC